jgi:hypothetical protein
MLHNSHAKPEILERPLGGQLGQRWRHLVRVECYFQRFRIQVNPLMGNA